MGMLHTYKHQGERELMQRFYLRWFVSLKKTMLQKISQSIKPTSGYNTEPVAEGYFAITHPDARADIEAMPGFTPIEKYASYGAVMAGEIGKVGLIRFIATTLATPYEQSEQTGHAQLLVV